MKSTNQPRHHPKLAVTSSSYEQYEFIGKLKCTIFKFSKKKTKPTKNKKKVLSRHANIFFSVNI